MGSTDLYVVCESGISYEGGARYAKDVLGDVHNKRIIDFLEDRLEKYLILSVSRGILDPYEVVEGYKKVTVSSLSYQDIKTWKGVVSEQIIRVCLEYNVNKIYFLGFERFYMDIIKDLKGCKFLKFECPFLGYKEGDREMLIYKFINRGKN